MRPPDTHRSQHSGFAGVVAKRSDQVTGLQESAVVSTRTAELTNVYPAVFSQRPYFPAVLEARLTPGPLVPLITITAFQDIARRLLEPKRPAMVTRAAQVFGD